MSRRKLFWGALLGINCALWLAGYNLHRTGHTRLIHDAKQATDLVTAGIHGARHVQQRMLGDRLPS